MGTTEESIVYQLLSQIRASELSNDEVITERRIRSFMRSKRTELIAKYSKDGVTVQDICFQQVDVPLTRINEAEWQGPVPGILRLKDNYGIKMMTPGFSNIPMLSEESYHLRKHSIINKYHPSAKIEQQVLTLRIPLEKSPYGMADSKGMEVLLLCLKNKQAIVMSAILEDPDDGVGYDWTKSEYPIPSELIDSLKSEVIRKDLGIVLDTKSDQVPNAKNDTLRYHDQGKVQ